MSMLNGSFLFGMETHQTAGATVEVEAGQQFEDIVKKHKKEIKKRNCKNLSCATCTCCCFPFFKKCCISDE